jgi:hypothetical protein
MDATKKGFSYTLEKRQIDDYRNWPVEQRLQWLFLGNKLRKSLPPETIKLQDAFRQGKI